MTTQTSTKYETIIGLEVHSQLHTKSKMFCSCSSDYQDAPPNTHVCPVCMGMPGVLPVINKKAVEYVIMTGLALNCQIAEHTKFDRKNYPYPDLMKGYQISQYDLPITNNGWLEVEVEGQKKRVGITRVHMEEDTARMTHHNTGEGFSLVDINRAGVPLMEIVSEPDMRSAEEAREYLMKLHSILQYIGVSTASMEEGSFRCDANVSLRLFGAPKFGPKVEVKNMNSFRAVYRAIKYEVERQTKMNDAGQRVAQETRGWMDDRGETVSQRSKEAAHDYRYFPEPDLPPLQIDRKFVEEVRAKLPELPDARKARFSSQYGLPVYDAGVLTTSRAMADYYEECTKLAGDNKNAYKQISNWLLGDLSRMLNASNITVDKSKVTPALLIELVGLIEKGTINGPSAKVVFEDTFNTAKAPAAIVSEKGLGQVSDASAIDAIVEKVVQANPKAVEDYRAGKEQASKFLVGQVLKESKGRANPTMVQELLMKKLASK